MSHLHAIYFLTNSAYTHVHRDQPFHHLHEGTLEYPQISRMHPPLDPSLSQCIKNVTTDSSNYTWSQAARGTVANESSLPGYAPLLFLLHHVEFGFSLLQLFLLLLDFLQQLLALLQQPFLEEQGQAILQQIFKMQKEKKRNLRNVGKLDKLL